MGSVGYASGQAVEEQRRVSEPVWDTSSKGTFLTEVDDEYLNLCTTFVRRWVLTDKKERPLISGQRAFSCL